MTWKKRATALFLSVLSFCSPCVGFCSANKMYQISESELTQLQTHLNELEQNNEMLKSILSESGEELTQALNALTLSQKELAMLREELQTCRAEASDAQKSLATANEELRRASESFKTYATEQDRIEGRLKNQRTFWQIIAGALVVYAVAK